jgi:hypothetical protein
MINDTETIMTDLAAKIAEAGKYIAQAKALRAAAGPLVIKKYWNDRELGSDANDAFGNVPEKDTIIGSAMFIGFNTHADALQAKARAIIDSLSTKPDGLTDADRDTIRVTQRSEIVETFIRSLNLGDTDDFIRTLIAGNIRNFAASDCIQKLAAIDALDASKQMAK